MEKMITFLSGGLAGSLFTLLITSLKTKIFHATLLYFDLKSISNYFTESKKYSSNISNIRYSTTWQACQVYCSFLTDENVDALYKIYDYIHDYNWKFNNLSTPEERMAACETLKDKIGTGLNDLTEKLEPYIIKKGKIPLKVYFKHCWSTIKP